MQPKLRFKTLSSDSKIFETNMGDIVTIRSGSSPSNFILRDSGLFPFLKVEELNNCQKYQKVSRNYTDKNKGSVPKNSIIFPKRGAAIMTNKVRITSQESLLDSNLMALIPITDKLDCEYLYQFLVKKKLHRIADISSIPQINNKHIEPLKIALPSLIEQGKIATFLSAVDEKISQLTKKNKLLAQHKKGVMQKIFSQELRFKADDGSNYPNWEEKKLIKIGTFFSGGTPTSTNKKFYKGNIPFIKSGEIHKKSTAQFINEEALRQSSAKLVKKGDILYALYGANSGDVSICKIDGAINQAILCIRTSLNNYFLLSYFHFNKKNIVQTYLQGGQGNLSAEIIKNISLNVPCSEEQTKVANFLSAIDEKIHNTQAQLEAIKQYKQGLLQQMFV